MGFTSKPPPRGPGMKTPAAKRDGNTLDPYSLGDPIPAPDVEEKNSDTAWALFSDLAAQDNRPFLDTVPPSEAARADEGRYAATEPAPLEARESREDTQPLVPAQKGVSLGEVIVEARRNNRVCPKPAHWQKLFDMLPDKKKSEPAPPLVGAAWLGTPSLPKRMYFREHLEWAAAHGCLEEVFDLMKSLPESEWHHMGE